MATQLQIRRGTTSQMNAFTGAEGELAVNTTTDTVHVHDGSTAGGHALAKADGSNIAAYAGSFTTVAASGTITGNVTGNLTGNVTGNITGSVLTAAQTNITSLGSLTGLTVSGAFTSLGIDDNANATAITIDSSSKVGIGVTNPSDYYSKDLVIGAADEGGITIESATTEKTYLLFADGTSGDARYRGFIGYDHNIDVFNVSSNGYINFLTGDTGGNAERMRIDASGRVGLSTSDPKSTLEVKGTFGAPATSGSAAGFISRFSQSSGAGCLDVGFGDPYSWIQSRASNNYATNFDLVLQPNGGNVGVGTSSPDSYYSKELVVAHGTEGGITLVGNPTTATGYLMFADGTTGDERYRGYVGYSHSTPDVMVFGTAGSSKMRIDASGNAMVGRTSSSFSATSGIVFRPNNDSYIITDGTPGLTIRRNNSDGDMQQYYRDGNFAGSIGTIGGNLSINGQSTLLLSTVGTQRVNVDSAQLYPHVDNTYNLGHPSYRFDDIYRSGSTYQTSDRNMKQDIRDLTDAERNVAVAAKGLLKAFRFIDAVEKDGDDANIHFGVIAQELAEAFEAEGLDANDYQVYKSAVITDDEGNEQTRLNVCYENLLAFIISAI